MGDENRLPARIDGFDEPETDDRLIQGELIKCTDGNWSCRNGLPAPETPLLVVDTLTVIQHWQDKKPGKPIVKGRDEPFPDIDALNAQIPREQWEAGVDNTPRPPWQLQKIVYFLREDTAERYTFASGTLGAHIAVSNLKTRVSDMRYMRGEGVIPLVQLANASMKTRFGQKIRTEFKIVGWKGSPGAALPKLAPPEGGGGLKEIAEPALAEKLADEIRY
jgi:hypothetical protein